jgi:hypothetical protein
MTERACSVQLGVSTKRFAMWRVKESTAFVPVEIEDEAAVPSRIAIVSPTGYRVEGLGLDEIVAVLRALA